MLASCKTLASVVDSYAARAIDGPPDDASETLAVALGEGDRAPRFLVGYRAPDDDMEPYLRALRFHADEAAAAGAAFVGGGDPNLPALQLPQSGVDLRACSGATETAGCRAFRTLLEESRLTVKSGTVAACGPGLDAALTHYRITKGRGGRRGRLPTGTPAPRATLRAAMSRMTTTRRDLRAARVVGPSRPRPSSSVALQSAMSGEEEDDT